MLRTVILNKVEGSEDKSPSFAPSIKLKSTGFSPEFVLLCDLMDPVGHIYSFPSISIISHNSSPNSVLAPVDFNN